MTRVGRVFVPVGVFLAILAAAAALWGVEARADLTDMTLFAATAAAVAWLAAYPLRISPSDDFPLVIVPVLVGLGVGRPIFPLAGGLLGLGVAASVETERWGTVRAIEEATGLAAAVLVHMLLSMPGTPLSIPKTWYHLGPEIAAAIAYVAVRTPMVATRIARSEGMAWARSLLIVANGTGRPFVVSTLLALLTVGIERIWLPDTRPVVMSTLPLLAAGVVLHVFHTHSMSGREQRRVQATIAVLADAMDVKDTLTGLHSQAVAQLSQRIARGVGVSERLANDAYDTGLLHDIGKVAVPDSILQKPSKLKAEEWDVMRTHVLDSAAMVASITGLSNLAPLVRASHEHYDGSGYPDGLRGREIPLAARIVALADAYHALTSDRVYRSRQDTEAALQELERCAGTQFDPELVRVLRSLVGRPLVKPAPTWLAVLRRPAFALLWVGEMVSFLGDEVFFIAITLWVYTLTGSAVTLAAALSAGYVAQAIFSFLAGAIADRVDRRVVVALSDVGRALVVAALPFVLPKSLPFGLILLGILNIGSVFFRAAVSALLPSIATTEELPTMNALFQTTERVAEILGGILGAAAVVVLGYAGVMFADAGSFLVSAVCVLLMPLAWGVGLGVRKGTSISSDLVSGLRYLWQTPFQRYFALLIIPGYLTLAFEALRAPMIVHAHLPAAAYGVVQSTLGAGKFVTVVVLAGLTRRWATPSLAVFAYVLAGLGVAIFAATPLYLGLIIGTFIFAVGNILTYVVNTTLVMQVTPQAILGRVLGNRLVLIQGTRVIGALALGRLADTASPPAALWTMAVLSVTGVLLVWLLTGRFVATPPTSAVAPQVVGPARSVIEPEPL